MVQFLVWNGDDGAPIVEVDGPFSNGNPSVGDTLTVRRSGSAVGQVTVEMVQAARRRAMVELVTGELPEAGDILRLPAAQNGGTASDATVVSMIHAPSRRGDIATMLDDGRHPGTKIVPTSAWDDPCVFQSGKWLAAGSQEDTTTGALTPAEMQAGERPDFVVIDVAGYTAAEARVALADRLAQGILGLPGTPRRLPDLLAKSLRIDYTDLPAAAITSLQANGRVTATPAQFVPFLRLKRGITLQDIENKITLNGRFPAELTNYLS